MMSWAALLLLVAGTAGTPPLAVDPPLVADFDECTDAVCMSARCVGLTGKFRAGEVYQAHSVVQAAKDAKRDLDAMRKAHDVALSLPVYKSNCRGVHPTH